MKRSDLVSRVRALTRDFSSSLFREQDIFDFLNESIDRCIQVVPHFANMVYLNGNDDEPILLPKAYHSVLAVYASARCFSQDERNYQAVTLMNEFETKLDELKTRISDGDIVIKDALGNVVDAPLSESYVVDNYYDPNDTVTEAFDVPTDVDVP